MCSSSWPLSLSYMTFTENPSSASHLRSASCPAPLNPTRKMWLAKIYPTRVWCATEVHHDYYYYYYYCYYYRIATLTRHWLALSLKGVNLSDVSWTDSRQTYLPEYQPWMFVAPEMLAGTATALLLNVWGKWGWMRSSSKFLSCSTCYIRIAFFVFK